MGVKTILIDSLFFSRTSDYLDAFLVKQCNRSEKTREAYRDALTVFKRYVLHCGKTLLNFTYADCTYEFLLDYKEYLSAELRYGPSSINQRLAAVKAYIKYSYGCDASLMQVYISTAAVPQSIVPKIQGEVMDEEGVSRLLNAPPPTKRGLRDTLIMSILFDAAIRLDELVLLQVGDIYQKDGYTYLLIHGKGNKERKVSLDDNTAEMLNRYLDIYHPAPRDTTKPLIYTVIKGETKMMSHRNIQKIIKKYERIASQDGEMMPSVHPHKLRRSRANGLYQSGVPIEVVSRFLGHSSVETTKDHYAFPSVEQMRKAMNADKSQAEEQRPMWEGHEDELAKLCGLR